MTIIIAGFPGVGKTHATQVLREKGFTVSDSDSSLFSWVEVDGEKERNPNFVKDYLAHIEEKTNEGYDIIFVSTHEQILHELRQQKDLRGKFYIVVPSKQLRDTYVLRYMKRGSDTDFIELMMKNFNTFVDSIIEPTGGPYQTRYGKSKHGSAEIIQLTDPDKFLSDFFTEIPKAPEFGFDGSVDGWNDLYDFVTESGTNINAVFDLALYPSNAREYLYDFKQVHDEYGEKHRWAIEREIVYQNGDKYLMESYLEGSTESQESYGFSYALVRPIEETIIVRRWV